MTYADHLLDAQIEAPERDDSMTRFIAWSRYMHQEAEQVKTAYLFVHFEGDAPDGGNILGFVELTETEAMGVELGYLEGPIEIEHLGDWIAA